MRGKHSIEARARMRAAHMGTKPSPETRAKMSVASKGHTRMRVPVGSTGISKGYLRIKVAQPDVWQLEHRAVMGLTPGDPRVVHHVDGDKFNNDPENLLVLTKAEHTALERKQK